MDPKQTWKGLFEVIVEKYYKIAVTKKPQISIIYNLSPILY